MPSKRRSGLKKFRDTVVTPDAGVNLNAKVKPRCHNYPKRTRGADMATGCQRDHKLFRLDKMLELLLDAFVTPNAQSVKVSLSEPESQI
jgi:hypothetical protein